LKFFVLYVISTTLLLFVLSRYCRTVNLEVFGRSKIAKTKIKDKQTDKRRVMVGHSTIVRKIEIGWFEKGERREGGGRQKRRERDI